MDVAIFQMDKPQCNGVLLPAKSTWMEANANPRTALMPSKATFVASRASSFNRFGVIRFNGPDAQSETPYVVSPDDASAESKARKPHRLQRLGAWLGNGLVATAQTVRVGAVLACNAAQNNVVANTKAAIRAFRSNRPSSAPLGSVSGMVAEEVHAATFNLNAIKKGAPYRAEVVPGGLSQDLVVRDLTSGNIVAKAQVKMVGNLKRLRYKLRDPKYDGMQKVVPAGMENPAKGHSSSLEYGGVRSTPLTANEANRAALDPAGFMDTLRPSLVAEGFRMTFTGAATGALVSGVVTLAIAAAEKRGAVDREDVRQAGRAAAVGAVTGGTSTAVGLLSGSPVVGAVTVAVVMAAHMALAQGDGASCQKAEAVKDTVKAVVMAALRLAVAAGAGRMTTVVIGAVLPPVGLWSYVAPGLGLVASYVAPELVSNWSAWAATAWGRVTSPPPHPPPALQPQGPQ